MVIHDMRNPTTSIKIGLENTILKLREVYSILDDQHIFKTMCEEISKCIEDDNQIHLHSDNHKNSNEYI